MQEGAVVLLVSNDLCRVSRQYVGLLEYHPLRTRGLSAVDDLVNYLAGTAKVLIGKKNGQ